jgi:trehalose 6-phosphate phosphatase
LGDEFVLQPGKQLFELKPTSAHKGRVVETFMSEPPFAGRTPVFLGDDVTDEDAFVSVNALGGHSIRIGDSQHSAARYHIDNVNEALQWLTRLATTLPTAR